MRCCKIQLQININDKVIEEIKKLSSRLKMSEKELVEKIIEAIMLYDPFEKLDHNKSVKEPSEFIKRTLIRLLGYGYVLESFLKSTNNWFGGLYQKGFSLEDMGMLEDNEGLWFNFAADESSNIIIDNALLQLQRDGDAYLIYSKSIKTREPGKESAEKIKKCIEKLEDYISSIEDNICDCPGHCELEVDVYVDDPDDYLADINVGIYLSDWNCIPDIELVNDIFKKIISCYEESCR